MSRLGSVASLDASSSNSNVFSFGVDRLSDVTLHYRGAIFHMHQYVLITSSKYFDVLLSSCSDERQARCSLCHRYRTLPTIPHHRCITLEGPKIGGVQISVEQLHEFLRCVYAETSREWRERIRSERQNASDKWPSHYYVLCVVSVDAAADVVVGDSYEIDCVRRHVVKGGTGMNGSKASVSCKVGQWIPSGGMLEHPNYHLADYFQCVSMMEHYEEQSLIYAEAALQTSTAWMQQQVWRILLLSDRYGWSKTRKICIQACSKYGECEKLDNWPMIQKSLKPATLAELFVNSSRRSP